MPYPASAFIRTPVFWDATLGLGLAYLGGALLFAHIGETMNFGWLGRFDFGPSLLLGILMLYGGAWLFWRRSGDQLPARAGWRGAAYGVLTPLAIVVLVGGYNAAEEALHLAPFYGATVTGFFQQFGTECFNYIVKPLAYLLPPSCQFYHLILLMYWAVSSNNKLSARRFSCCIAASWRGCFLN